MEIKFEEQTAHLLKEGKINSPDIALKELKLAHEEYEKIRLGTFAIRVKEPNFWEKLILPSSYEQVLKKLEFRNLTVEEQETILEALRGKQTTLKSLPLKGCTNLRDHHFKTTLPLRHLVKVDIRECSQVGTQTLVQLSIQALGLKELNIALHPSLQIIVNVGTFNLKPLVFPQLQWLNLASCVRLEKIILMATKLTWLNVEGCVKLLDEGLDSLIEHSPQLQTLRLNECHLIQEKEIRQNLPSYTYDRISLILNTPLINAAANGDSEVVQILLEKSANINLQDNVCSNNLVFFTKIRVDPLSKHIYKKKLMSHTN
jgi:hypothetical protein